MKRTKKAQVSIEAITLTGFLVLFLVMGMGFFMVQFSSAVDEKDQELLTQVSEVIIAELQMARSAEPGYERVFYIPSRIELKDFLVNFPPSSVGAISSLTPSEAQVVMVQGDGTVKIRNILLGNDVIGALNTGNNYLYKSDSRILLIPEDLDNLSTRRFLDGNPPLQTQIAYTKLVRQDNFLSPLTVNSTIRCEVAIVNANPNNDLVFSIYYSLEDDSGIINSFSSKEYTIDSGSTPIMSPDSPGTEDEDGGNISSVLDNIRINGIHYTDFVAIGEELGYDARGKKIACNAMISSTSVSSESIMIEDSLPFIEITEAIEGTHGGAQGEGNSWEITTRVEYGDQDSQDNTFNVTFVAEGTNAGFIVCIDNCKRTGITQRESTIKFIYSIPSEIGGCNEYNTLGFKVVVSNSGNPERSSSATRTMTLSC